MGRHYIPKYYLKGFTETTDSPFIWTYEKGIQKSFRANIKNIAQETGFYSEGTEKYLANEVEQSGNSVLDKIREEKFLTHEDKVILSNYMAVLLKRVPMARNLVRKWNQDISKIHPEWDESPIDKAAEAQEIWESLLPPETTPDVSGALQKMNWKFLVYDKEPIFLTSDNPIFFPSSMGIGNIDSEVTFPISTNIALWASWSKDEPEKYVSVNEEIAHEINRWSIKTATQYIYFSKHANWVIDLVCK